MTLNIEFNSEVWKNLKKEGYTHIYRRGIKNESDENDNDYILVPLKPTDIRIRFEESDLMIHPIDSSDITDMLSGDPFIRFMIELSE